MQQQFEQAHRQQYGFITPEKELIVAAVSVEVVNRSFNPEVFMDSVEGIEGEELSLFLTQRDAKVSAEVREDGRGLDVFYPIKSVGMVRIYTADVWHETPVFRREDLQPGDWIDGPALIVETTGTNVIEVNWQAQLTRQNYLILRRCGEGKFPGSSFQGHGRKLSDPDPVLLEIFNNLFRSIAEQMGITLQNTSCSVNIKERLDFSCALFDQWGQLVANAPHIPVHLGSMSESVASLIAAQGNTLKPGDVYVLNNPYNGGTHLPDVTVITPVFWEDYSVPLFYVAARGHHADIGGITPGSMPPNSTTVEQEGVLLDNFKLVEQGRFRERELGQLLLGGPDPVRNLRQNLADLQAQIAANERGVQELRRMVSQYSLETVQAYMGYVQDNAEAAVRRVIERLPDGSYTSVLDDGSQIQVTITCDRKNHRAKIDFTGTSPQLSSNFNAPAAVCKAAVLYVFRTLVNDDIPLNAGCLKPLEIIIPEGCLLNPRYPAAVVAGNVETSQAITDALYGAMGVMAASQGTMNNFTFGNGRYQYYETICGGSGAGADFDGTDAVHTHMTNSRLTDPEVLEWRFPVLLESFSIRPHSGGNGAHRGGNGVIRRLRFLEPMTGAILSSHRLVPPFGLHGGAAGALGKNYVERSDGTVEVLGGTAVVEMNPGDIFIIETPGGGGYGCSNQGQLAVNCNNQGKC